MNHEASETKGATHGGVGGEQSQKQGGSNTCTSEACQARLREVSQELESFIYSVSHDLQAPLRAIEGFTEIIAAEHARHVSDDGKQMLDIVLSETGAMREMINGLVTLSRVIRSELVFAPLDMGELADAAFQKCSSILEPPRQFAFRKTNPLRARGDKALVSLALENLFANAVKFTKPREVGEIVFGCREGERENIYYVSDNGAGFRAEYGHRLFRMFQRLHTHSEFEGRGTGLAIVRCIIERHGGRVWAEAELGKGATFYFTLPSGNN